MKKTKMLLLSWILAFVLIAKASLDGKQENTCFQGIAETREVIVNCEHGVEIRNIHVTPGQTVERGRLLAELERPELNLRINEISHQLEELKLQEGIDTEGIRAQIRQLNAEKAAVINESDSNIAQLRARYNFNKEVSAGLQSIAGNEVQAKKGKRSPIEMEIELLQKEKQVNAKRIQVQIDNLKKSLQSPENPADVRIESLERELALLKEEKQKLLIYSQLDGIVGSVLCKRGEKVSPFAPILTLYSQSPSYVSAYIHEHVHHSAAVGESVEIVSFSSSGRRVQAEIVGTGSRIVEYPLRLRKRPDMQIWGREVEIRLPEDNPFLLGEKVMVCPEGSMENQYVAKITDQISKWLHLSLYAAEPENPPEKSRDTVDIRKSKLMGNIPEIEASGLIYLPDLHQFLLISDETENREPVLYLMDSDGMVRDKTTVKGMKEMDDMEAICTDENGNIYIASSQTRKKNGQLPDHRKLFVQIRRNGTEFEAQQQILLYDLLMEAAKKSAGSDWAEWIKSGEMEIEGMFWHQNALYAGCKNPLNKNRAVILRISEMEKVLQEKRIVPDNVQIWRELDLPDEISGKAMCISDLYLYQDRLYVLSCGKNDRKKSIRTGALRVYDAEGKQIYIRYFKNLNPEGICFDAERRKLVLTFDEGGKHPSKMLRMEDVQ
ncbi:MAG: hypothetical protein R2941_06690 [Desulfobacterales bacterium]